MEITSLSAKTASAPFIADSHFFIALWIREASSSSSPTGIAAGAAVASLPGGEVASFSGAEVASLPGAEVDSSGGDSVGFGEGSDEGTNEG